MDSKSVSSKVKTAGNEFYNHNDNKEYLHLLEKLFEPECECNELDFGLYRIIKYKKHLIKEWINKQLPSIISKELSKQENNFDIINYKKIEKAVYKNVYNFFTRLMRNGNYVGRYAPYNGESVYFYWSNKEQYYVKTGKCFMDYKYKTPNNVSVYLKILKAELESDNTKKLFVPIFENITWDENRQTLTIPFSFCSVYNDQNESINQETIVLETVKKICEMFKSLKVLKAITAEKRINKESKKVLLLEYHIRKYIRHSNKNIDFFIHKNLRDFLYKELDLYLKNEFIDLDNIKNEIFLKILILTKKVFSEIIEFLSSIEEFQKSLFEKKKFITETFYIITVGNIPHNFYDQIASCEEQWDEWRRLGFLDISAKDLFSLDFNKIEERINFLKNYPTLPLDTRYFSKEFTDKLLACFDNLDDITDGLLVHSDNWQALNLLKEKYREKVKCIYIDPPYNTGNNKFPYLDSYQHSSWLSMMENRLYLAKDLLSESGVIFISIDDNETANLRLLLDGVLNLNSVGFFVWEKKKKGSHLSPTFRKLTEYIHAYTKNISKIGRLYGELTYANKLQPLIHRSNAISELVFPSGTIYASIDTGHYKPGIYGEEENAVELLDMITIQNGIVKENFRMKARFIWTQKTLERELKEGSKIILSKNLKPETLRLGQGQRTKAPSSLIKKHIATYEDAFEEMKNLFGKVETYSYTKPTKLIDYLVKSVTYFYPEGIILDFFAGFGTTGHTVINLNREDGGKRKFIMIEIASYFDTLLIPRIKKITFTSEWKKGLPKRIPTKKEKERSPRIIKVIRLESYEDTLNNLIFEMYKTKTKQYNYDYLLQYELHKKSNNYEILINKENFQAPFSYKIILYKKGEFIEHSIDLPETFNYLLGLDVEKRLTYKDNERYYLVYRGKNLEGRTIIVIWRETYNWTEKDYERDKKFIIQQKIIDGADEIFINDKSNIIQAKPLDKILKNMISPKINNK
ncbi:MAG: site-specific DNA-methyltransferase [Candidatus Bilamarchaeaceae archaeon]